MKKTLIILLTSVVLVSCVGRYPSPISATHASDQKISCSRISSELAFHDRAQFNLQIERSRINRHNLTMGIAGFFVLIPLFFLNISDAPEIEQYAIARRMNKLQDLQTRKGCN